MEEPSNAQLLGKMSSAGLRTGMSTLFTDKSKMSTMKIGASFRMGAPYEETARDMTFSQMMSFKPSIYGKASRMKSKTSKMSTKMSTYLLMQQENYRERMAKARDARMFRSGCLFAVHRHVLDLVAFHLNIDPQVVEDGVCDEQSHILLLDSLFSVGGRQAVMFVYQEMENPSIETGRFNPMLPKDQKMLRIVVTDGGEGETSGPSVVVYRTKCNITIDAKNISEELYFRSVDLDSSYNNPVPGLIGLFSMSIKDRLHCSVHWGELTQSEQGRATLATFLECVDIFIEFLQVTQVDLEGSVMFDVPDDLWTALSTPEQINKTIEEPEIMEKVEKVVQQWGYLIEKALTKDMEIRREKETIGPLACLIYWRRMLAMNSSIVEHLRSIKCKNFILALQLSKSKYIKKWTTLENMVTNVNNEVEDNVKYLYALEKYLDPLYHTEPNAIDRYMPCLMYCIRMVYSTSRYFNTNDRLTGLLVKVTNQLITACRGFLTNDGTERIWDQSKKEVLRKIKICLGLHKKYADCYHQMKDADKEFSGAALVDCSEVYVFGKLGTFQTRLERITHMIETNMLYSILESSRIEGIAAHALKFNTLYHKITDRQYDVLDHRKREFDSDYSNYLHDIHDAEEDLKDFLHHCIDEVPKTEEALHLLKRFEKLNLPCLKVEEVYLELMDKFHKEMEEIRDHYHAERKSPPIGRLMPPVTGRILWARHLHSTIEAPMEIFKTKQYVLTSPKAANLILLYNTLTTVFVHYEIMYHTAWYTYVEQARRALELPTLSQSGHTCKYTVNFDPYICEAIRETEQMLRLRLEVPSIAQLLVFNKKKLFESWDRMKLLVNRNTKIRKSFPKVLIPLMRTQMLKMQLAFQPALSILTWQSLKISEFFKEVTQTLDEVEIFVKEITDLKEARIDEAMESIATTLIVKMPPETGMEANELQLENEKFRAIVGHELEIKSYSIEKALTEMINKFIGSLHSKSPRKYDWMDSDKAHSPQGSQSKIVFITDDAAFREVDPEFQFDLEAIHDDCMDLFSYYSQRMTDTLIRTTKFTLETLKRRACCLVLPNRTEVLPGDTPPMFITHAVLQIPILVYQPSINELQKALFQLIASIFETHKNIALWGQRYIAKPDESDTKIKKTKFADDDEAQKKEGKEDVSRLVNFYTSVTEHKEVVRAAMGIQTALSNVRQDAVKLAVHYVTYNYLWPQDREEQVEQFVENNPSPLLIQEEFNKYLDIDEVINAIPECHILGPLVVKTGINR